VTALHAPRRPQAEPRWQVAHREQGEPVTAGEDWRLFAIDAVAFVALVGTLVYLAYVANAWLMGGQP
jgi:hypothetical protein